MSTKQKKAIPCSVNHCERAAVYMFRREIEVTNHQSSGRESIYDTAHCCKAHERETAKDFSEGKVEKITL
jgi:hypothetical protein